ncbi:hypothetical protein Moror_16702, partial [Moniliophthora roreri MCA 2997]
MTPEEETLNNLISESTSSESIMNPSFNISDEKIEESLEKLQSTSLFSRLEQEDNMSEGGSSTLKREQKPRTQEEMMITVATAVIEEVEKKKKQEKGAKVVALDPFEGDRKDTKQFLTE